MASPVLNYVGRSFNLSILNDVQYTLENADETASNQVTYVISKVGCISNNTRHQNQLPDTTLKVTCVQLGGTAITKLFINARNIELDENDFDEEEFVNLFDFRRLRSQTPNQGQIADALKNRLEDIRDEMNADITHRITTATLVLQRNRNSYHNNNNDIQTTTNSDIQTPTEDQPNSQTGRRRRRTPSREINVIIEEDPRTLQLEKVLFRFPNNIDRKAHRIPQDHQTAKPFDYLTKFFFSHPVHFLPPPEENQSNCRPLIECLVEYIREQLSNEKTVEFAILFQGAAILVPKTPWTIGEIGVWNGSVVENNFDAQFDLIIEKMERGEWVVCAGQHFFYAKYKEMMNNLPGFLKIFRKSKNVAFSKSYFLIGAPRRVCLEVSVIHNRINEQFSVDLKQIFKFCKNFYVAYVAGEFENFGVTNLTTLYRYILDVLPGMDFGKSKKEILNKVMKMIAIIRWNWNDSDRTKTMYFVVLNILTQFGARAGIHQKAIESVSPFKRLMRKNHTKTKRKCVDFMYDSGKEVIAQQLTNDNVNFSLELKRVYNGLERMEKLVHMIIQIGRVRNCVLTSQTLNDFLSQCAGANNIWMGITSNERVIKKIDSCSFFYCGPNRTQLIAREKPSQLNARCCKLPSSIHANLKQIIDMKKEILRVSNINPSEFVFFEKKVGEMNVRFIVGDAKRLDICLGRSSISGNYLAYEYIIMDGGKGFDHVCCVKSILELVAPNQRMPVLIIKAPYHDLGPVKTELSASYNCVFDCKWIKPNVSIREGWITKISEDFLVCFGKVEDVVWRSDSSSSNLLEKTNLISVNTLKASERHIIRGKFFSEELPEQLLFKILSRVCKSEPGMRALSLCCGTGPSMEYFLQNKNVFSTVVFVDIDQCMLSFAVTRLLGKLDSSSDVDSGRGIVSLLHDSHNPRDHEDELTSVLYVSLLQRIEGALYFGDNMTSTIEILRRQIPCSIRHEENRVFLLNRCDEILLLEAQQPDVENIERVGMQSSSLLSTEISNMIVEPEVATTNSLQDEDEEDEEEDDDEMTGEGDDDDDDDDETIIEDFSMTDE